MSSTDKDTLTGEFAEAFKGSVASFLISYQGTKCEDLTKLRRKLRPAGARLAVIKNTLARRALKGTTGEKLDSMLTGPTAVVWAKSDPVSSAKIIAEFSKEIETFKVKGGLLDGEVVDASSVAELAKLPSREELYAKLLAVINAPATKLLQTINAPATQLTRVLDAWRIKLEEKGGEAV